MDLIKACKQLIIKDPFYGLFLLNLKKSYSDKVLTAGVGLNNLDCELLVNKEFWDSLTDIECLSVLKHELMHVCLHHLTMRDSFEDFERFNWAGDLEINGYLTDLPGKPLLVKDFNFPEKMGTKWYYDNLPKNPQFQQGQSGGNGNANQNKEEQSSGNSQLDNKRGDHSQWKAFNDLSDAEKQLIDQQIDHVAKNTAEQVQKMAGSIPGELKEYIDGLFKKKPPIYNWRKHFRRVVGNSITSDIVLTRMRPSKRFPDARGIKLKRKPKILVGIDTSGSISKKDLSDFFTEIQHMYKTGVDITIAECDTKINKIYKYTGPHIESISGRGGTILNELYTYYKENKDFSSMIIFTDGYLFNFDFPPMKKVIWVITSNGNKSQKFPGIQINIPNE